MKSIRFIYTKRFNASAAKIKPTLLPDRGCFWQPSRAQPIINPNAPTHGGLYIVRLTMWRAILSSLGILAISAPGCSVGLDLNRDAMVGEFQPAPYASTLGVILGADGRYQELGFLMHAPVSFGGREIAVGVDGIGPIDAGTWTIFRRNLTLHSSNAPHADRVFSVELNADSIGLRSGSQYYFKPNHSAQPPPPKGG